MAELAQSEIEAIAAHPIGKGLDDFRTTFASKYLTSQNVDVTDVVNRLTSEAADRGEKDVILDLIMVLQVHPAARNIRSRSSDGPLSGNIAFIYSQLSTNQINAKSVAPLLKLVVTQSSDIITQTSDIDIWLTVLNLIARTRPRRLGPPTLVPWKNTSEHRKQVDDALKQELFPSLRIDIPDFIDAVFGLIPQLDELTEAVFKLCVKGETPLYKEGSGWARWPQGVEEEFVLKWLQDLMESCTAWMNERGVHGAASRRIYQRPGIYLAGSTNKRKIDVGIVACHEDGKAKEIIGDLIPNWTQILVAGELKRNPVKDAQNPAWVDLATYARELGYDHIIQRSDGKRYIKITRNNKIERLILTEDIKQQAVIVGRAITCWRAYPDGDKSREPLIVKDSWQYEERPEEGELIKEATDKGVRNIARYYHHETVQVGAKNDDTLENVRKGLMKTCGRTTFRQRPFKEPLLPASGSLRKSVASRGQSKSLSSSSLAQMAPPASNKRSCSSRLATDAETPTHKRVHRRVITKDAGKPIYKASSPIAIISGFIGAIYGHKCLLDAGILHRDISIGNIMLTGKEDDGFLIDLDLAIKTSDDQASSAPSKAGTKIFIAIGALLGEPHSFMHDLESFFWVLFWICIHYDGRNEKGDTKRGIVPEYKKWKYADTKELAPVKKGLVVEDEDFSKSTAGFTSICQPLAPCIRDLRRYIFPDGKRWHGENKALYSQMETVLEKARNDLEL
ncbi:hypothetical protein MMC26_000834 [Xylographa opegraphella]|nr:hypothetical protein [Xylographa opegraphella]